MLQVCMCLCSARNIYKHCDLLILAANSSLGRPYPRRGKKAESRPKCALIKVSASSFTGLQKPISRSHLLARPSIMQTSLSHSTWCRVTLPFNWQFPCCPNNILIACTKIKLQEYLISNPKGKMRGQDLIP